MKKTMSMVSLLLAILMIFSLVACSQKPADGGAGSAPAQTPTTTPSQEKPTEVQEPTGDNTIVIFSKKREWEAGWNAMREQYMANNPQIKDIVINLTDASNYYDLLKGYLASNDLPDIIQTVPGSTIDLWAEHLVDLNGIPAMDKMQKDIVDEYLVDGKYLGIPLFMELHGVIYNMKYLNQVGYEKAPETLDEFIDLNQKLQTANLPTGISPWKGAGSIVGHMTAPIFGAHEDSVAYMNDIIAGKVDLTQDAEWNALFDYLQATMEYGNKDALNTDNTTERNALYAEQFAWYAHDGSWLTPAIKSTNPDLENRIQLGVYPFTNDASKNKIGRSTQSLSVMQTGRNEEEVKKFIDWMLGSDEGCKILVEQCNTVILRTDYEMSPDYIGVLSVQGREYVNNGRSYGNFRHIPDSITKSLESPLQKFIGGAATKEDALKELQSLFESCK